MSDKKLYISSERIQLRVRELGGEISRDYRGRTPVLITLLKGAFIFCADLIRHITIPHEVDFITLRSYEEGFKRRDPVEVLNHLRCDIEGRDIIVVDEIIDTGRTISQLMKTLSDRRARSLRICTLLDKPSAREVEIPVDYVGFTIPNVFVVGYGLDFMERFRNLSHITELTPEQGRLWSVPVDLAARIAPIAGTEHSPMGPPGFRPTVRADTAAPDRSDS